MVILPAREGAVGNLQSPISNLQSPISNQQSAVSNQQSAVGSWQIAECGVITLLVKFFGKVRGTTAT
ncbi:MAG: hypothetical protein E3K38_14490 [Candidatus Kuenenia stuttgartiensis]|nr:hypothetical protein [Candidatus Kuenenia stuttgartiensis]